MKKLNKLIALLLSIAAIAVFSACVKTDADTSSSNSAPISSEQTPESEDLEEEEISEEEEEGDDPEIPFGKGDLEWDWFE